ncbi:ArnT family glycosyltransferase [candidate division CSSED10-310 bacterium]|uniref:ArnT family glycosyltransferase n=1 Tax=candidate division CSSED10-310 bacterium TaxID=2855610 RepID=A0ABV6YY00_UNCC1
MKSHLPALVFLVLLSVIRLTTMASYGLSDDEAYYWEWSRNLAPAYYDQGPGVAYAIALGTALFGHSELGVRFPALFIGIIMSVLGYVLTFQIFQSRLAAFFALLFLTLAPLNFIGSLLMVHDTVMYLFWALFIFTFVSYLRSNSNGTLYWCSIWLGLGLLSKHTTILLVPTIFVFLALRRDQLKIFRNKHLYLSGLLTFLVVSPLLYWNLNFDWAGVDAIINLPSASSRSRAFYQTLGEYVGGQIGIVNPVIFFFLAAVVIREIRRKSGDPARVFLATTTVFMLLFFALLSLKKTIQPNWTVCCYFGGLVLLGGAADVLWRKGKRVLITICLGTSVLLNSLIVFPAAFVVVTRVLNIDYNRKALLTNRLVTGSEIGHELDQVRKKHPTARIFANRYQAAALMAFYLHDQPRTYCFNIDSRPNQFDYWESPDKYRNEDFIYVQFTHRDISPEIIGLFSSYKTYPPREVRRFNKKIRSYQFAYMEGFKGLPQSTSKH